MSGNEIAGNGSWTWHVPACSTTYRGCAPWCPKDVFERTGERDANCGPIALAAATGAEIQAVMAAFGADWPGYTNQTRMVSSAVRLGLIPSVRRRLETPRNARRRPRVGGGSGVAFIQWHSDRPGGGWGSPRADYRHTHWIAVRRSCAFDANLPRWMPFEVWSSALPAMLEHPHGFDVRAFIELERRTGP